MNIATLDYVITVAGAAGSKTTNSQKVTINYPCEIRMVSIIAPSAAATYTVRIKDADGFTMYYETGITGDFPILLNAVTNRNIEIHLSGATDGAYSARIWLKS